MTRILGRTHGLTHMLLLLGRWDARSWGWMVGWLGLVVFPAGVTAGSLEFQELEFQGLEFQGLEFQGLEFLAQDPGWLAQLTPTLVTTGRDTVSRDGLCSLREAVEAVNTESPLNECLPSSVITFDAGLAGTAITLNSELAFTKDVEIRGQGSDQSVISGGQRVRVLSIGLNTTVTLRNVTLADGRADRGAGVYNLGSLVLVESVLIGHTATDNGGAIFNRYDVSEVRIDQSVLTRNSATTGGALFMLFGSAGITNSSLAENTASVGGAIYNRSGELKLLDSTISGNVAVESGGGLYNEEGSVTLTTSRIEKNEAAAGGGLTNFLGPLELIGTVVSGNTAAQAGGGILSVSSGPIKLDRSQILENGAAVGGGLYNKRGPIQGVETFFVRNQAREGSALFNQDPGQVQLQRCSVTENQSSGSGSGAIQSEGILVLSGTVLQNSPANVVGEATGKANDPESCNLGDC